MKESNPEYAKVTIVISTPDSNIPTKIQQSRIEDNIHIDELQRLEIKKHSDTVEGAREKQNRQENIGLCIVFVFMVSYKLFRLKYLTFFLYNNHYGLN